MDIEARVRRLEDTNEIRNLTTRYGLAMDERNVEETRAMFTPDAVLTSKDGVFAAEGIESIMTTFAGRWDVLGPTSHWVHGQIIEINPSDPDRATGTVTSHAELDRNREAVLVSLIYEDTYVRHEGIWKFAAREMGYFYYTPAEKYTETMLSPNRNLAYDEPLPADYPVALKQQQ
ncbi:MAG: nuclear transport factor 2 family protein [Acidimicrobiales bacterium]|jgi:hypothetical protein|nr:nuclear transport factor 2 family protein [Acidimicrobiales bacterium]|tara:strand:- start:24 stop:548 length:525 start_codon:yes stop_codon:yes gene_type:complete